MKAICNLAIGCCFIIYLTSCDKDPVPCADPLNADCPNYDSCLAFAPAQAGFLVYDSIGPYNCQDGRGKLFLTSPVDTFYAAAKLFFRALHNADTYAWTIGTDPKVYTTKSFGLNFNVPATSDISVKLVACKTPPSGCMVQTCDTSPKQILFRSSTKNNSNLL